MFATVTGNSIVLKALRKYIHQLFLFPTSEFSLNELFFRRAVKKFKIVQLQLGMGCCTSRRPPKLLPEEEGAVAGGEPVIDSWDLLDRYLGQSEGRKNSAKFSELHLTIVNPDSFSVFLSGGPVQISEAKIFSEKSLRMELLPEITCSQANFWEAKDEGTLKLLLDSFRDSWKSLELSEVIIHKPQLNVFKIAYQTGLTPSKTDDETYSLRLLPKKERVVKFSVPQQGFGDPSKVVDDWKKLSSGKGLGQQLFTPILIVSFQQPGTFVLNFQTLRGTEIYLRADQVANTIKMVKCHCLLILCPEFDQESLLKIMSTPPHFTRIHFLGKNESLNFDEILQKLAEDRNNSEKIEVFIEDVRSKPILTTRIIDYMEFNDVSVTETRFEVDENGEEVKILNSFGTTQDSLASDFVNVEYVLDA